MAEALEFWTASTTGPSTRPLFANRLGQARGAIRSREYQSRLPLRSQQLFQRANINQPTSTDLGRLQTTFGDQTIKLCPSKPRRLASLCDGAGNVLVKLYMLVRRDFWRPSY